MTINRVLSIMLGVTLAFAVYLWWPSDEAAIRSRLNELAAALSAPANEQELGRVARVAQVRGFLAEDVHVRMAEQDITPRDMVLALASRWTVTPRDARPDDRDTRTADVVMVKRNGEWVIASAETKEPVPAR